MYISASLSILWQPTLAQPVSYDHEQLHTGCVGLEAHRGSRGGYG